MTAQHNNLNNMKLKLSIILISGILFLIGCEKQSVNNPVSIQKEAIKGLVTMGSVNDLLHGNFDVLKEVNIHPDIYSGVVIRVTWSDLEPQRGSFNFSSIETALDRIRHYNNIHNNHKLGAKLRVSATVNTPNWVLALSGGPVEIVLSNSNSIDVGLFWTDDYRQAWQELQQELSKNYDDNPLINEVCITSATMVTDEPFVTIFNQATIVNLHAKGFTDNAYKQALIGALDDYSYWKNTPLDFSFNMYREIDNGYPVNNLSFTLSLINDFRSRYGKRAVISNHGLQENLSAGAIPIYNKFLELGNPIATQTKSPNDLTDQTFRVGLSYEVSEFEIWDSMESGGPADFNIDDLKRWEKILENH